MESYTYTMEGEREREREILMKITIERHGKNNEDSLMNCNLHVHPNSSDQHHRPRKMTLAMNDVKMNLKIAAVSTYENQLFLCQARGKNNN